MRNFKLWIQQTYRKRLSQWIILQGGIILAFFINTGTYCKVYIRKNKIERACILGSKWLECRRKRKGLLKFWIDLFHAQRKGKGIGSNTFGIIPIQPFFFPVGVICIACKFLTVKLHCIIPGNACFRKSRYVGKRPEAYGICISKISCFRRIIRFLKFLFTLFWIAVCIGVTLPGRVIRKGILHRKKAAAITKITCKRNRNLYCIHWWTKLAPVKIFGSFKILYTILICRIISQLGI